MPLCFLPGVGSLRCEQVEIADGVVTVHVRSSKRSGACPLCGRRSTRVHSHYLRTLADLPWQGRRVRVRWRSRRFFCDNRRCSRRVFTERRPEVAASYGRTTQRCHEALCHIALTCSGQAGARLAERLGMPTSPDHLLRIVRRLPDPEAPPPRVLGVDDWALRRGQRYGTILCDLQRHRPVDLFPARSAQGLADWLRDHPSVCVISRDRGDEYAKGAREGAPRAVQVADRWHLLHNLHEAVMREAEHHSRQIVEAAKLAAIQREPRCQRQPPVITPPPLPEPRSLTRAERRKQANRDRRRRRYEQTIALHRQGISLRAIARSTGLSRRTVRRFLRSGGFPERAGRRYPSRLDPFARELHRRWDEGCRNATTLFRELQQKGFTGSYSTVSRRVTGWRTPTRPIHTATTTPPGERKKARCPSPRRVAWLLTVKRADLDTGQQTFRRALRARCPVLKTAGALARWFARMVRKRQAHKLHAWIARACAKHAPPELRRFAQGLLADLPPIEAALTLPWSNGQVEGQINRLKLIKRQMYGRANFDLLRIRFLHAG
jgi:transposase